MALAAITGPGWWFPSPIASFPSAPYLRMPAHVSLTLDAATEKIAFIGRIWINGKPAGTKVISAAGSGKIHFNTGTVVWANVGTSLDVGIQDLDSTTGPPNRPDGTFDVKATLVPGTETLTSSAWHTFAMETGTKSIAHGDLIAVVFDLTAVAGGDVVRIEDYFGITASDGGMPQRLLFTASWVAYMTPIVLIEFDDGTLATLDGALPLLAVPSEGFNSTTNPNERGLIFRCPRTVKVDMIVYWLAAASATSDFDLKVYSTPLTSPYLEYSASVEGATLPSTGTAHSVHTIPSGSEIQFTKDVDYAITMRATGATNITLQYMQFANQAYRVFLTNGLQLRKGTRYADSGVFAETTTLVPLIGFRVSHDDDGTGGGAGGGVIGGPNKRANMQ